MKIVVNHCYGGFGLSYEAVMLYAKLVGIKLYTEIDEISKKVYGDKAVIGNPDIVLHYYKVPPEQYKEFSKKWHEEDGDYRRINATKWHFYDGDIKRDDPNLIKVVEELGDKSSDRFAELEIVEIPDGVDWEIDEYDGMESIHEKHRSW